MYSCKTCVFYVLTNIFLHPMYILAQVEVVDYFLCEFAKTAHSTFQNSFPIMTISINLNVLLNNLTPNKTLLF